MKTSITRGTGKSRKDSGSLNPDSIWFFRVWLSDPMRVAAIAPSSPCLARLITAEITPSFGHVIELGPGTGAFTKAILDRGISPEQLTLVESGEEFVKILSRRFPDINLLHRDASSLRFSKLLSDVKAGAVVSGLPLLSMSPRKVLAILSGSLVNMQPTAAFYQFTYGFGCPVPRPILDRLGLRAQKIAFTFNNMPPARVYRFTRRRPLSVS